MARRWFCPSSATGMKKGFLLCGDTLYSYSVNHKGALYKNRGCRPHRGAGTKP